MDPGTLQLLTVAGAAGALGWVLKLLTSKPPGLHTHSEVEGLRQDKADLLKLSNRLAEGLQSSNEADREILAFLKARLPDA